MAMDYRSVRKSKRRNNNRNCFQQLREVTTHQQMTRTRRISNVSFIQFCFTQTFRPLNTKNHWRWDILTVPIVAVLISGTMCFRPLLQPPKHRRRGLPDPPWRVSQTLVSPPCRWLLFRFKIGDRNRNWTKTEPIVWRIFERALSFLNTGGF